MPDVEAVEKAYNSSIGSKLYMKYAVIYGIE
jgi:hypothetical protein